ncbi:MAG: hypothetical protein GY798_17425 [Hyphomicrobiales bacterium]|nr:hypothetical protein [Hyphomicrobiales bacterium]
MSSGQDIVVYPEIYKGNHYEARRVVRYLLNKPGYLVDFGMEGYGADEYLVHFAEPFKPDGYESRLLTLPLVDRTVFRPRKKPKKRKGTVVYSVRYKLDPAVLPEWAQDCVVVSRANMRRPDELARLYRRSRAFITGERTAASAEALHCGCPVLIVPHDGFEYQPIVGFYKGNGIGVGVTKRQLRHARRTVDKALEPYGALIQNLDGNLNSFVKDACRYFSDRGL